MYFVRVIQKAELRMRIAQRAAQRVARSWFKVLGSGFLVQGQRETFEKCSFLFKFKEGEIFNRRNTLSISRIAI